MKVLLVRHGQTRGNVAHRHQVDHTPLTILGRGQVQERVEVIKKFKPTHLVTSNMVRAIETARIIGDACNLIPETNEIFIELVRPRRLYGYRHRNYRSLWFYLWWYLGRNSKQVEEGESYEQLRERIKLAKANLAQYPTDARVAVVSHAVFIAMFVAHLCRTRALTPWQAVKVFSGILTMPNVHTIEITFNHAHEGKGCAWSVDT